MDDPEHDENAFNPVQWSVRTSRRDTPLRDITDQFFHPPSPSPTRPPRRPKKPKSLAYPADPPNWRYAPSSSSLPPSSPFPPSDRREYVPATPSATSDSDPFGFVAVERAIRAKRATSPPRSTVLPPVFTALDDDDDDDPIPTNNEDIEGLYTDDPVAGPSHVVAPLLLMNSDQPLTEPAATFPDPLRTPRKRKRRASPVPRGDEEPSDAPSSPSPVKVSAGAGTHRRSGPRPRTRAHVKTSHQRIPTPSSTRQSERQSTAPPTPVPPRRSKRQAAADARTRLSGTSDAEGESRMKLRSRVAKPSIKTTTRPKQLSKSKPSTAKPARGRPKGKNTKGKGKARPLESVLDLSDDTRERYEKERRARLEYFKRLEGYQIQKENVYVV